MKKIIVFIFVTCIALGFYDGRGRPNKPIQPIEISTSDIIKTMSQQQEIILLEVNGTRTFMYKKPDNGFGALFASKVSVAMDYNVIFSIQTELIWIDKIGGVLSIEYDDADINCKSVSIGSTQVFSEREFLGERFMTQEVMNMIQTEKRKIKAELEDSDEIKKNCIESLDKYMDDLCNTFGVKYIGAIKKHYKNAKFL